MCDNTKLLQKYINPMIGMKMVLCTKCGFDGAEWVWWKRHT